MHDGEVWGWLTSGAVMVVERGLLTVPEEMWALAVLRAEVIGRLAAGGVVGHEAADAAAAELGVSRREVYLLLGRWRAGEGVVSDLLPRRSSGGRGREHLPAEVEAVMRDVGVPVRSVSPAANQRMRLGQGRVGLWE